MNNKWKTKNLNELTEGQYDVTQNVGIEKPFQNEFWNNYKKGIYVNILSGKPLFVSTDKYDSDCGWPSFSKPIDQNIIIEKDDNSWGIKRTEVLTNDNNIHLGHIFNDGPKRKRRITLLY